MKAAFMPTIVDFPTIVQEALAVFGSVFDTEAARRHFAESRHVDRQEPCRSCWARYLCGGGCHAEVLSAGRSGCDYIRGWLEFCISLYPAVLTQRPDLLGQEGAS